MLWEDVKASEEKPPVRHPNRDLPESHTARLGVVALLLVSVAMLLMVALGGWSLLVGAKVPIVVFAIIYAGFAYFIWEWRRGMLPVISAIAVVLAIFALVAGPDWFARDKVGYTDPTLPAALLGVITLGLIPVQMLLIVVSMWGFSQKWNVEEEIHPDEPDWPADRPKPTVTPQAPPAAAPAR
jgi:fatty acid desaturase